MKIVLCQNPIVWENPTENIAICNRIINEIFKNKDSGIDIIVFPEFFTYEWSFNIMVTRKKQKIPSCNSGKTQINLI
jgi:predicted amidohydrolase